MAQNTTAPDALDTARELDQLAYSIATRHNEALGVPVTMLDRCIVCGCVRVAITEHGLRCALCGAPA